MVVMLDAPEERAKPYPRVAQVGGHRMELHCPFEAAFGWWDRGGVVWISGGPLFVRAALTYPSALKGWTRQQPRSGLTVEEGETLDRWRTYQPIEGTGHRDGWCPYLAGTEPTPRNSDNVWGAWFCSISWRGQSGLMFPSVRPTDTPGELGEALRQRSLALARQYLRADDPRRVYEMLKTHPAVHRALREEDTSKWCKWC